MTTDRGETMTLEQALSRLRELEQVVRMARPLVATLAIRPGVHREKAAAILAQLDALRVR